MKPQPTTEPHLRLDGEGRLAREDTIGSTPLNRFDTMDMALRILALSKNENGSEVDLSTAEIYEALGLAKQTKHAEIARLSLEQAKRIGENLKIDIHNATGGRVYQAECKIGTATIFSELRPSWMQAAQDIAHQLREILLDQTANFHNQIAEALGVQSSTEVAGAIG